MHNFLMPKVISLSYVVFRQLILSEVVVKMKFCFFFFAFLVTLRISRVEGKYLEFCFKNIFCDLSA